MSLQVFQMFTINLFLELKKFSNENYSNFFQKFTPVTEQYLDLNYRQGVDLDP
jgi:hypothetical protein